MAWQTLPCSERRPPRREHWNELIAAANERNAQTLSAAELPQVSGNVPNVRQLAAIRSRVAALIPYFADWNTGAAYTKATALAAAIGKADWTTPTSALAAGRTCIRAPHVNDLWAVLDALVAVKVSLAITESAWYRFPNYGTGASWATAWTAVKSAYAGSSWTKGNVLGAAAGLSAVSYDRTPSYYEKDVNHLRTPRISAAAPMYSVPVIASRAAFRSQGVPADSVSFEYYLAYDFAGSPVAFAWPAGGACPPVDIPAYVPGALITHGFRSATDKFSSGFLDGYQPADAPGATAGFRIDQPTLLNKLDWTYAS